MMTAQACTHTCQEHLRPSSAQYHPYQPRQQRGRPQGRRGGCRPVGKSMAGARPSSGKLWSPGVCDCQGCAQKASGQLQAGHGTARWKPSTLPGLPRAHHTPPDYLFCVCRQAGLQAAAAPTAAEQLLGQHTQPAVRSVQAPATRNSIQLAFTYCQGDNDFPGSHEWEAGKQGASHPGIITSPTASLQAVPSRPECLSGRWLSADSCRQVAGSWRLAAGGWAPRAWDSPQLCMQLCTLQARASEHLLDGLHLPEGAKELGGTEPG